MAGIWPPHYRLLGGISKAGPFPPAPGGGGDIRGVWGSGTSSGVMVGDNEPEVLAMEFVSSAPHLLVRSTNNPSLNFSGNPFNKIALTRSSSATYINSAGLVASAAIDVARYDYDPSTLNSRGLLLEESRTNSALQSEVLGATWVASNLTVGANTGTGADGATTADRLTSTLANATLLQTVTTTAIPWTFSIWIRRITGVGNIDISCDGATWVTKSITTTLTRFETTLTMTAAPRTCGIRIVTSGDVVEAWGGQFEAGGYATSYMPTTTIAVTRSADVASVAGSLFPLSQTAGTLFLETEYSGTTTASGAAGIAGSVAIGDGTANEKYLLSANNNAGSSYLLATDGGVDQASIAIAASSINTIYKLGGVWQANDFHHARGGALGTADSSGTLPTTTTLYFGGALGTSINAAHYRRILYLPRRISNADLQVLTT